MRKTINHIKQEIIIVDGFVWMPSVMNSDVQYVSELCPFSTIDIKT